MIEITTGDITKLAVDAVVNAANESLLGGGGVDGAIHRAAGPQLLAACREIGGCPTGEARITPGFRLPAKWVIHTVGPVWIDGRHGEPEKLAACYRNSLDLARTRQLRTVAFPAISTGAYGYPKAAAAAVAVACLREFEQSFDRLVACCFSAADRQYYDAALVASSDS
jgi:O-acetyl-ADP-ribose deacetylase